MEMSSVNFRKGPAIDWKIWKAQNRGIRNSRVGENGSFIRNHKVHYANIPDPLHTLQQAQKLIQKYLTANKEECKQVRRQQSGSDNTTWRPPPKGFYKANVDASWVNHLQQASAIGFTWTRRVGNEAAHMVAKLDQENNLASRWWLHPPQLLRKILTEDKRRIPPSMRLVPPPGREVDNHSL
ncbi:hypothetical protein RJT34_09863 [Clitoria ternatea]|uniref:RNase H type-1 domain-containing protein n=1 Tax=Clitoria ternatea TaxID=43366 RepID=A0AAN9K7E0_CLITE